MIESIRYGDFTLSFTAKGQNLQEKKMVEDINQVMSQFRSQLSEKEEKHRYFETLLDTVDTSVLVSDKEGKILWMNRAGIQDLCGYAIHARYGGDGHRVFHNDSRFASYQLEEYPFYLGRKRNGSMAETGSCLDT